MVGEPRQLRIDAGGHENRIDPMVVDGVSFDVEFRAGDDVAQLVVARRKLRERDVGLPDAVEVSYSSFMAFQ